MHRTLGVLLVTAMLAAVGLWYFQRTDASGVDADAALPASPSRESASSALEGDAPTVEAAKDPVAARPSGEGLAEEVATHEVTPRRLAQRDAMLKTMGKLTAALAAEKALDDTETEEEEQAREAAWSTMVAQVKSAVRSDPYLAEVLYAEARDAYEEPMAVRAARILQQAHHGEFVARIQRDAATGAAAKDRRLALIALETRPADTWLAPVTTALETDADPAVRDEAAGVLSRSLMDRRYVTHYAQLRAPLQRGLKSEDPLDRARAARAMLGDPMASPEDVELLRALKDDEDAAVRREVLRTLRVLEGRVERARAGR